MTVKMEKIIARYFDGTQSSNCDSEINLLLQRNRKIFDLGHDNAANQLSATQDSHAAENVFKMFEQEPNHQVGPSSSINAGNIKIRFLKRILEIFFIKLQKQVGGV